MVTIISIHSVNISKFLQVIQYDKRPKKMSNDDISKIEGILEKCTSLILNKYIFILINFGSIKLSRLGKRTLFSII